MLRIDTPADVEAGLDHLCRADPRLVPVRRSAGEVPLRRVRPGFASLVSIVVSQQVSRASADAMLARLEALAPGLEPAVLLAADRALYRSAGLSGPKERTLRAVAAEVAGGGLDLAALCTLDAAGACARLTALPGVGPWTAEVYLLFAAGHPDIFPARDLALQAAVGSALSLESRPGEKALAGIAESWRPWRGVAARLFWAWYGQRRSREVAPAPAGAPIPAT